VLAVASYPLAAMAMASLLVAMGCAPLVAWVGGFVFATGPLRLPLNLIMFEYQNLFLPVATLALARLRDRPGLGPALGFGIAYTGGLFCSYYMAAMLTGAVAVWTACELARPAPGRVRFAGLAALASAAAIGLLVAASGPYLARASSGAGVSVERAMPSSAAVLGTLGGRLLAILSPSQLHWLFEGRVGAVLAVLALVGLWRDRDLRRLVVCGLAITLAALVVILGWWQLIGWMPPSLRFFRAASRLIVLRAFGTTLLLAAGLEVLRRRLGAMGGTLVVVAMSVVVVTRGRSSPHSRIIASSP
jgi:hypothetical protein